jgi:cell division protein FtsX
VGVAAHPHVWPARIENLVSIGRTVGIVGVMLLVVMAAATAATIATAARPLPIVWSH